MGSEIVRRGPRITLLLADHDFIRAAPRIGSRRCSRFSPIFSSAQWQTAFDGSSWHESPSCAGAERVRSAPGSSDIDFFDNLKGIIDLDAKIPHGASIFECRAKAAPRAGCRRPGF
jgi:hypothetical protein